MSATWKYVVRDTRALIVEPDGATIVELRTTRNTTAHSMLERHARLMAAAPDLLEALEVAEGMVDYLANAGNESAHAAHAMILAALAKARESQ